MPPAQLVVSAEPPTSVTAGNGFGLTVSVEDAYGNLVTGYGSAVTIGLVAGPASGNLGGSLSAAASGGVATFSGLSIDLAGSGYAVQATGVGLTPATTTPVGVTPAAPAQLVIPAGPPSTLAAGSPFGLAVSVEDAYGNLVTGYGGEVTVGLVGEPDGVALGGVLTVPASGGVATFGGLDVTESGSGYTIAATGAGLTAAASSAFTVTPAAPARLVVTTPPPSGVTAGGPFGVGVSVEDAYGNLVTGFDGDVTLALSGAPTQASLSGTTTVAAAGGVATFAGLTLDNVGQQYLLQATSTGLASAGTAAFGVSPAAPAQLVITAQPSVHITAGSGFGLGVAVEDAFGNIVTGFSGDVSVSMAAAPAGASLAGQTTVVATNGIAAFSGLSIDKAAGNDSLRVAATGVGSATTAAFAVIPAAPSRLAIVTEPPDQAIAGQGFGFTVAAEDPYGNVATTFNGPVTVTLASGPAGGSLSGVVSTTAANGIATFSGLALDTAGGGYALAASGGSLTSSPSTAMTVSPSAPSRLIIVAQPSGTVVRKQPFAVAALAVDAYGNIVTGYDGTVTAALAANPNHNTLTGTLSVQASGGQAVISDASLKKTGKSYAITITSNGLTPAATSAFNVSKPAGGRLAAELRRSHGLHRGTSHPAHAHHPGPHHRH